MSISMENACELCLSFIKEHWRIREIRGERGESKAFQIFSPKLRGANHRDREV